MFNYKCPDCEDGVIRKRIFKDYETSEGGVSIVVPHAKIGVCDVCGAQCFNAKETKRWTKGR